jgi:hypothetical protein
MVSGGHLAAMTQTEAAVYLVLCVVADRHGISYYHPASLGKLVHHPENRVRAALDSLHERRLIAAFGRLVQVLPVELVGQPPAPATQTPVAAAPARRPEPARPSSEATVAASTDPRVQNPPGQVLARLTAECREQLLAQARSELAQFLGSRSPSPAVVEALAASIAHQQGKP